MSLSAILFGLAAVAPTGAADEAALAAQLRVRTQALVDAIAPGDKAVWDAATDPALIFVTENNEVLTKAQMLGQLTPLPKGLVGHINVIDYNLQRHGDSAVATYIDDERLDYHGQLIKTKFRVTDSWHQTPAGWRLASEMTNAVLNDPPAMQLPPAKLAEYAGRYELTPDIHYTIRLDGGRLLGLRDGGNEVELKAEVPDVFFVLGSPRSRKIFYRDASGHVTGFGDRREGQDIKWRRLS
jgi:ketosteroid isomerase-like protein